jgi:hypothetical protein
MSATKTIKYVGRHREGVLVPLDPESATADPDGREYVEVGYLSHVDLPVKVANSLLEQEDEWHPIKATKKAAAKKSPAKAEAESAPAPAEADTPTPADVGAPLED